MRMCIKNVSLVFLLCIFCGCGKEKPSVDIWMAAASGNVAEIEKHIAYGTNLNEQEEAGQATPLIITSVFGQTEAAELLIKNGADLETKNKDGSTALMSAVFFCYPDIVTLLLENGAEVNSTNNLGSTPLDVVAGEWGQELEGIYTMVASVLKMDIDLERVKKERSNVAAILRKHGGKTSVELK